MKRGVAVLASVAWFAAASPVVAQDAAPKVCKTLPRPAAAAQVLAEIKKRMAADCYDATKYPEPVKEPVALIEKAGDEGERSSRRRMVGSSLALMQEWLRTHIQDQRLLKPLQSKVVDAHSAVIGARPTAPILDPTGWRINESFADGTLTSGALGVALNPSIEDGCRPPQAAVEKCRVAIADVEAVFRAHSVLERGLTVFHAEVIPNLADLFKKRTEMWDIYRTEARPQYPWEWIVNGMVDTTLDDRKKDAHKNPIGPANLPSGQIILLHPGVGLERFDIRGTDQSASNPTLYLEWFGYNKLQWDYDAGKLRGGLGVSFVSVYSQRQDASDWSRGIMFWVSNKYGVAVTRNDSGTSIMVSVDVGELYRGKMNELNEWLRPSAEAK